MARALYFSELRRGGPDLLSTRLLSYSCTGSECFEWDFEVRGTGEVKLASENLSNLCKGCRCQKVFWDGNLGTSAFDRRSMVLHVSCIRYASLQALSERCTDPTVILVKMPSVTERYENAV